MSHFWTLTLFAAEEIPSALVTFVALLVFLQLGAPVWLATLFAALLFLPWMLKSWGRSYVRRAGNFKYWIHLVELLMAVGLAAVAMAVNYGLWWTLGSLLIVSTLCSWHELLARMYYERVLSVRQQRAYEPLKIVSSQMAVVLTYGLMLMLVGVLQVYFRQRSIAYSWSLGCYAMAGIFLLIALLHWLILERSPRDGCMAVNTVSGSLRAEMRIIERISKRPLWWRHVLVLQLLLLPQGLMFLSRTVFLLDKSQGGGLGCTLQEIGFAQGTVGVIAFMLGISLGRWMLGRIPHDNALQWTMYVSLGLSPLLYLAMAVSQPDSLFVLCMATLQAQFLFGFGLNGCRRHVRYISGERYRTTVNLLYVPLISLCMFLPMALSGWMLTFLSYQQFFLIDLATAPVAWLAIKLLKK